jgi:SAM-dependent methyltransferase
MSSPLIEADLSVRPDGTHNTPEAVAQYYEEWTDRYIEGFGSFFQAQQTHTPAQLMSYIAQGVGLSDGQRVLDAGCGIGGPAIELARQFAVDVEGVTISPVQVQKAGASIAAAQGSLKGRVNVREGDFHHLSDLYGEASFDVVYFLEALVHSHDPERVVQEVRKVLRPYGRLYLKDLFQGPSIPENEAGIKYAQAQTNAHFCLHVRPMGEILELLNRNGFMMQYFRRPLFEEVFDLGNAFTAKHHFKLRPDQNTPWRDEGFIYLNWMELMAVRMY